MVLTSLHDLLVDEIRDLYSAEQQLTKALPKMAKAARSPSLKRAFTEHLAQTREHVKRLEEVCDELECEPTGKTCAAMQGLLAEGNAVIGADGDRGVIDAALIGAARRVEHYEFAAYDTSLAFAESLGLKPVARLLKLTRDEEEEADALLAEIALDEVNPAAKAADEEEEEGDPDEDDQREEEEDDADMEDSDVGGRGRR